MDKLREIFVDSNIHIFANIEEYPEHSIAKSKIKELVEQGYKLLINLIIVSEVQYKLYRLLDSEQSILNISHWIYTQY